MSANELSSQLFNWIRYRKYREIEYALTITGVDVNIRDSLGLLCCHSSYLCHFTDL